MAKTELAYVLPEGSTPSGDAQVFAGVPGIWTPGVPIPASQFDDTSELDSLIAELGLPIERHRVPRDADAAEEQDADETDDPTPEDIVLADKALAEEQASASEESKED